MDNGKRDAEKWSRDCYQTRGNDSRSNRRDYRDKRLRNSGQYKSYGNNGNRNRDENDKSRHRGQYRAPENNKSSKLDSEDGVKKLKQEMRDMKQQLDRALSSQAKKEETSKYETFILDSEANPSFVHNTHGSTKLLDQPWQVISPNGPFRAKKVTKITLTKGTKKIATTAQVHARLTANLLSIKGDSETHRPHIT